MKLKHVGVWSLARLAGVLYAVMGLIVGVGIALASVFGAAFMKAAGEENAPTAFLGPLFGVGAVFVLPVMYGILGMLGAAFSAWLYNTLARALGGVELVLE